MAFDNNGLYAKILDNNKKRSTQKPGEGPGFFKELTKGVAAPTLWIDCPGSCLPNTGIDAEKNMLSVLDYAVNILKVKHIIVCGHYGGSTNITHNGIKEIYRLRHDGQDAFGEDKPNALVELNVSGQVADLAKTSIVQNAWKNGQELCMHGWVYGPDNHITDLEVTLSSNADLQQAETA